MAQFLGRRSGVDRGLIWAILLRRMRTKGRPLVQNRRTTHRCFIFSEPGCAVIGLFVLSAVHPAGGAVITVDPFGDQYKPPRKLEISMAPKSVEPGVIVRWDGDGRLQHATGVTASWRTVATESPYRISAGSRSRFFRIIPEANRPTPVYVPGSYDPGTPAPLVISLHGYGLTPDSHERLIPLKPFADFRGFIYVTPRGGSSPGGGTFWNAIPQCCDVTGTRRNDSLYLRRLIESIQGRLNIDPRRIHLLGHSNGGMMSYRVACEHAGLIASIASLAGATFGDPDDCRPSEPVSVLQIHGTADPVVTYAGGAFVSAMGNVETWALYNQCGESREDPDKTLDLDLAVPGVDTKITRATQCPRGVGVELWTILGGGHGPLASWGGESSQLAERLIDWLYAHPKPSIDP